MTRIVAGSGEYEQMVADHGGNRCHVYLDGKEMVNVHWVDEENGCLELAVDDPEHPGWIMVDENDKDKIKTEILHGKVELVWR